MTLLDRQATHDNISSHSVKQRRKVRHWQDVDPERRGVVLAWVAFTATFLIARLVTGVIKLGSKSATDVSSHGLHLHHFLWGIILLGVTAVFGLVDRSDKTRAWMGIGIGIGLGLIIDEAALLITLRDVYWHTQGWISIAIALVIISLVGTTLVLTRNGRYDEPT